MRPIDPSRPMWVPYPLPLEDRHLVTPTQLPCIQPRANIDTAQADQLSTSSPSPVRGLLQCWSSGHTGKADAEATLSPQLSLPRLSPSHKSSRLAAKKGLPLPGVGPAKAQTDLSIRYCISLVIIAK